MLSWISLVPPSIELPFDRSQSRGALPVFDRSLSHSSASLPPANYSRKLHDHAE